VAVVSAALGPSIDTAPHGGVLGGSPTTFLRFTADAAANGLVVWTVGDLVVAIEGQPYIRVEDLDALGPPGVRLASGVSRGEQLGWPERGLLAHLDRSGGIRLLYGLPPTTPDAMSADPITRVVSERRPV